MLVILAFLTTLLISGNTEGKTFQTFSSS